MSQPDIGALIEVHEGERPSAPLLLLVTERSRGNPLVVEEVLDARRELTGASLTAPLAQLILGRVGHRSADCRGVLRALALAEGPLALDELATVAAAYRGPGPGPASSSGPRSGVARACSTAILPPGSRRRFARAVRGVG